MGHDHGGGDGVAVITSSPDAALADRFTNATNELIATIRAMVQLEQEEQFKSLSESEQYALETLRAIQAELDGGVFSETINPQAVLDKVRELKRLVISERKPARPVQETPRCGATIHITNINGATLQQTGPCIRALAHVQNGELWHEDAAGKKWQGAS